MNYSGYSLNRAYLRELKDLLSNGTRRLQFVQQVLSRYGLHIIQSYDRSGNEVQISLKDAVVTVYEDQTWEVSPQGDPHDIRNY